MNEFSNEKWVTLYHEALLELETAKIAGRIGEARNEIAARIEKLQELSGLHETERHALADALTALRVLERAEARHEENERRIAEIAAEKLRQLEARIESMKRGA
jgi:hypothetical protein